MRHPNNKSMAKMKSLTKSLLTDDLKKQEMLVVVKKIRELERSISSIRKMYSLDLGKAIKNDNYYIEIPHQISHSWNETDNTCGWIYLLTATQKPGQVKVGATTMLPKDRVKAYRSKYGYPVSLCWSKFVRRPFSVEDRVKSSVSNCRVSGLTEGDSNEWYHIDPSGMIGAAENQIRKNNIHE
jgi:hypothetical protein